jgi:hypothetical protein
MGIVGAGFEFFAIDGKRLYLVDTGRDEKFGSSGKSGK